MSFDPPSEEGSPPDHQEDWIPPPPGYGPPPDYGPPPYRPVPGYRPPPLYGPPPGGFGNPPPGSYLPYPPPQYGGYPRQARTDGTAIAALILSIASFVVCPIISAVIALVLIPGSRANIRRSGGTLEGESLLTAAKVISLIHLGLVAVAIAIVAIAIAVASRSASTAMSS